MIINLDSFIVRGYKISFIFQLLAAVFYTENLSLITHGLYKVQLVSLTLITTIPRNELILWCHPKVTSALFCSNYYEVLALKPLDFSPL